MWESNDRCNQENLIAQLKSGVHALETPLDNLESNWAYMVMASLAWNLKAWFGLSLPEKGHRSTKFSRWSSKRSSTVYPRPCPNYSEGEKPFTAYSRGILGSRFFFEASLTTRMQC